MNELRWSNELAKGAQLWANQCKFKHDGSVTCSFDWIGQNLYTSGFQGTPTNPKGSWKDAVDSWYSEVLDITSHDKTMRTKKKIINSGLNLT